MPVVDGRGVEALVRVHDQVFGEDHSRLGRTCSRGLTREPRTVAAVLAMAGRHPIAAGRMEFHPGTEFASLWGGGTLAEWRGRGVFRSLVAYRAALAAARGVSLPEVDASADSRPILRRLGFVELASDDAVHVRRVDRSALPRMVGQASENHRRPCLIHHFAGRLGPWMQQ